MVSNPKTSELTKSHKAIVVRVALVEGTRIFAIDPPQNIKTRVSEYAVELTILRNRVRAIFQKLVSRGIFPSEALKPSNYNLNNLLDDPAFLLLALEDQGQKRFHEEVSEIVRNWKILKEKIPQYDVHLVTGGYDDQKLGSVSSAHGNLSPYLGPEDRDQNFGRRVRGANFVVRKFNGRFLYNSGAGRANEDDPDPNSNQITSKADRDFDDFYRGEDLD